MKMSDYKLVPVDPTPEMASEGARFLQIMSLPEREAVSVFRAMLAAAPQPTEQQPALTKYQPCGCVICTCEHETQCQGCGAQHCGTHPVGQIPGPVYQQPTPDVACSQSRESAMVVLEQGPDGTPAVWCDPEIADLVSALNKAGIRTVASCSGHGHRPGNIMLSDGRELAIARDFDEARKIDAMFPGINGEPPMVDVKALVRLDDYEALQAELEQWKNGSTIRDEQNEELHQYVLELKTEIEKLRKDAAGLVGALECIASWPNGGNRSGQTNIRMFAAKTLAAHCKGGEV